MLIYPYKVCVSLLLLSFLVGCGYAQSTSSPKYEVTGEPICWRTNGKDSNLVRYTLLSPSSGQPKALFYINSLGAAINPVGGILKMGWCCNCGGGGGGTGPDLNGIYTGSGFVPNATKATAVGDFDILGSYNYIMRFGDINGTSKGYFVKDITNKVGVVSIDSSTSRQASIFVDGRFNTDGVVLTNQYFATGKTTRLSLSDDYFTLDFGSIASPNFWVKLYNKSLQINQFPVYASDAAADLDSTLLSGSLYRTSGDRTVKIKP